MLKRNDLVKQFEDIVEQEIINHNRQIESTNQRLNELEKQNNSLIKFNEQCERKFKALYDSVEKIFKNINEINNENDQRHHRINNRINDIENLRINSIKSISEALYSLQNKIDEIKLFILNLEKNDYSMKENLYLVKNTLCSRITEIEEDIRIQRLELKKDISDQPCKQKNDIQNIKNEVLELYKNIDSIKQEISAWKNLNYISKKESEYCVERIKRIQEKIGV